MAPGKTAPTGAYERGLRRRGYSAVAGVDEAGRGALVGAVVAAAVILPERGRYDWSGIRDSKLLTPGQREAAFGRIVAGALAVGVGAASPRLIDEVNILKATLGAMRSAILRLSRRLSPDYILIDGNHIPPELELPSEAIVGGDRMVLCIAAASIIAKVTRDRLMTRLDALHPGYQLAKHKGYATPDHLRILGELGATKHHRFSFEPVREAKLRLDI